MAWHLNTVLNDTSWCVTHLHPETRVPSKYLMAQIEQAPARNEKCMHKWPEGKVTHGAGELHSVKNVKNILSVAQLGLQWGWYDYHRVNNKNNCQNAVDHVVTGRLPIYLPPYLPTHLTNYIQQSSLRTNQSLAIQENPLHSMEPKGSLLRSQMPNTCPDPKPDAPVRAHPSSLMLSSYL